VAGHAHLQQLFVISVAAVLLKWQRPPGVGLRKARPGQIQAIHRNVFRLGDTVLNARTGYGKSIVLQAVSVILEGMVTIQVVPLTRLGEEQSQQIARMPGTRPILLADKTDMVRHFI
jgi:ABC-type transport system involved in cytochrome bd biosynthesis fused ATPase/permease subunit